MSPVADLIMPAREPSPGVEVVKPGPLCSVQDLGRSGGLRQGVSPGGAMDRKAIQAANQLLGAREGAPALEITLGGAAFRFLQATTIALTGADCAARLDGAPVTPWSTVRVERGQELRLGYARSGLRAYLAFPGGILWPTWFGSASMVAREGHPLLGRPLPPGTLLSWKGGADLPMGGAFEPPSYPERLDLTLTVGYEFEAFEPTERARVFDSVWTVSSRSDRTATLLDGPPLKDGPVVLDSVPLVDGTVQVLASGRLLIFMRDRPTIGGYPKLGAVHPDDLDRLAQARAGTAIRFVRAV